MVSRRPGVGLFDGTARGARAVTRPRGRGDPQGGEEGEQVVHVVQGLRSPGGRRWCPCWEGRLVFSLTLIYNGSGGCQLGGGW